MSLGPRRLRLDIGVTAAPAGGGIGAEVLYRANDWIGLYAGGRYGYASTSGGYRRDWHAGAGVRFEL